MIKEIIVKAIHDNFSEFADDQAEAIINALGDSGFVVVPKVPDEKLINAMKRTRSQFSTMAAENMYASLVKTAGEQCYE